MQMQQYRGRNREGMLHRPDLKGGTALSALRTRLSLKIKPDLPKHLTGKP